jgi:hypothetical protein
MQQRTTQNYSTFNDETVTLKSIIKDFKLWYKYIKAKYKIILLFSFIGIILSLLIARSSGTKYKAVLSFAMEDDKNSGVGGALSLASSFGIDLGGAGGGAFASGNISELMRSKLIVQNTLLGVIEIDKKITTLADYYIEINKLKNKWKNTSIENISFAGYKHNNSIIHDSVLQIIYIDLINKKKLKILQNDKLVTILNIEVLSSDEKFAKYFTENLAKESSKFYIETKSKKAKNNVEILQKQVDSIKNQLNYAINGQANETDMVYNLNPALNIKTTNAKRKQIDVQANTTILTNLVVQLELAKIALRKETPLIQIIDLPEFPLQKESSSIFLYSIIGFLISFFLSISLLILSKSIKDALR